jgi:uncharacterized protein (DUF1778 family)
MPDTPRTRAEQLHVRLSPDEKAMLKALAESRGFDKPSQLIRVLIREATAREVPNVQL